jgi:hypothetical protein
MKTKILLDGSRREEYLPIAVHDKQETTQSLMGRSGNI